MTALALHVPALDELWYRRRMMEDPATMSYNAGYDLSFDGYHGDTGCIDFPVEKWQDWYARFVQGEPERFYAYVVRREDGAFVGEVCLHLDDEPGSYGMGVVIEQRWRGMGYGSPALKLLLDVAFHRLGAKRVHNEFESTRAAALRAHLAAGFRKVSEADGVVNLEVSREDYLILSSN